MKNTVTPLVEISLRVFMAGALCAALGACGNGASGSAGTVAVQGDVPIAYTLRANSIRANPTNGAPSAPGGDLMVREKSSPSALEHNITASITQGAGDASDPEVSYDGKKIVFALRCPSTNTSQTAGVPACTGRWNIWEYDMTSGGIAGGSLRRITSSSDDDDVDPAYLPAGGGFVFSSNRQTKSRINQALGHSYYALDEYERERVFNLHTMAADGSAIAQISFNQSHDRNPVVRPNGDIMFSRWEHVGDHNRFAIFRVKPDGTDMFVLYGALSPGNSFLHPRDMDPAGPYAGQLSSSLMPLSRTQEGGALMFIDAANYSEANTPANATVPTQGGQRQVTQHELATERGLSLYGRITTPYPLWDGTQRVLLSYTPCEVHRGPDVVPCATLTPAELTRLSNSERLATDAAADVLQDDVPASYAVYMFDPQQQTWLIVAAPPKGFMFTDPIALQARAEPNATHPTNVDAALAAQGLALIEVRSVYDTDGLGRMGEGMLVPSDLGAGCAKGIATMASTSAEDLRASVADLARMKDPADSAYRCAPARFVRALRAIAPPQSSIGLRRAIGETSSEQQQIVGYAPVEPDGSFKLLVPADTPLALQIMDAKGRAYQSHPNWIQARPGERRTCDGCHSPRRGGALNSGAVVNRVPAAWRAAMSSTHLSGETMASQRTRLDPSALQMQADMVSVDPWADTTQSGVVARTTLALRYVGNALASDDLVTPAPVNGVINYPEHIQPLWTRSRGLAGVNTCTHCHNNAVKLDLRSNIAGSGRLTSYDELLIGDPLLDPVTGAARTQLRNGVPELMRVAARVQTSSNAANTAGQARKSRLTEVLFGETLLAGAEALALYPDPPAGAPDHSSLLNQAEKRLLSEWMDLGGQYYNDPFNPDSGVRSVAALSQASFEAQVLPVLRASCVSCHQPAGTSATVPTSFRNNRFILTGDASGDYNATLAMVSNTCNASANDLLSRPSTVPHPGGATAQTAAPLPLGSAAYNAIANWIGSGC